jgi:hypothetical protein
LPGSGGFLIFCQSIIVGAFPLALGDAPNGVTQAHGIDERGKFIVRKNDTHGAIARSDRPSTFKLL